MRRWVQDRWYVLRALTFLVAFALIQVPLPIAWQPYRPEWVLCALMLWLWHRPTSVSFLWISVIGVTTDFLTGLPIGTHMLSYGVVAGCVLWMFPRMRQFSRLQQMGFTLFLLLLCTVMMRLSFALGHVAWCWADMLSMQLSTFIVWSVVLLSVNFHRYWFAHVG
jgi:rod shape-determining protein MreD